MGTLRYGFERRLADTTFDQAVEKVTAALKTEGFGVLTEIDVKATLRKKLDVATGVNRNGSGRERVMASSTRTSSEKRRFTKPALIAGCLLAAVAVYFLWEEHESHILGALFWLLLLACPAIHFFMHGKHGHGGGGEHATDRDGPQRAKRDAP